MRSDGGTLRATKPDAATIYTIFCKFAQLGFLLEPGGRGLPATYYVEDLPLLQRMWPLGEPLCRAVLADANAVARLWQRSAVATFRTHVERIRFVGAHLAIL